MNDASNAKSTIADKIHRAVNALIETELRLNADLIEARAQIARLQEQLATERHARQELERMVSQMAEVTGSKQ